MLLVFQYAGKGTSYENSCQNKRCLASQFQADSPVEMRQRLFIARKYNAIVEGNFFTCVYFIIVIL